MACAVPKTLVSKSYVVTRFAGLSGPPCGESHDKGAARPKLGGHESITLTSLLGIFHQYKIIDSGVTQRSVPLTLLIGQQSHCLQCNLTFVCTFFHTQVLCYGPGAENALPIVQIRCSLQLVRLLYTFNTILALFLHDFSQLFYTKMAIYGGQGDKIVYSCLWQRRPCMT